MDDRSTESISALMDGEVEDFELRRILARADEDPQLAEEWQRYHIARSAMKGEESVIKDFDISDRVMAALEDEPAYDLSDNDNVEKATTAEESNVVSKGSSFWRPLASMAAAASVTAMVILGAQTYNQTETETIADNRPSYVLPSNQVSSDLVRAQFGQNTYLTEGGQSGEIIRASEGIERYISQHKHMLTAKTATWQASWLPEGFNGVRQDVMAHAEIQMFSNGRHSFTVCVEEFGKQTVPEGVAESQGMVAVGKKIGDRFVTVVGDVPIMIAERIAASVEKK